MEITYDNFLTDDLIFTYSILGEPLFGTKRAYIDKRGQLSLFDISDLEKYYNQYQDIKLLNISEEKYSEFTKLGYNYKKTKSVSPVHIITGEFLKMQGDRCREVRKAHNNFTKGKYECDVRTEPNNYDELLILYDTWKKQKKDRFNQKSFITYEEKYLNCGYSIDKFVGLFFYIDDRLISYLLMEKINDIMYNALYHKLDLDYPRLSTFTYLAMYKYIFENITKGTSFYVNVGDPGLYNKGLYNFKTTIFDNYKIFPIYTLKVIKDDRL